jgi:hypothetical protein
MKYVRQLNGEVSVALALLKEQATYHNYSDYSKDQDVQEGGELGFSKI